MIFLQSFYHFNQNLLLLQIKANHLINKIMIQNIN